MQNLNDRLASYLQRVRSLESANGKLEQQIKEFNDKRCIISTDLTIHSATISDLRAKIARRYTENQSIILQIENAHLAMDDFKMKYEMEVNMCNAVEADVARLRGIRDSMKLSITDLSVQIQSLKEELAYLKTSHAEEMERLRVQQSGTVNVQVDNAHSVDLTKVLDDMRGQYEAMMMKNKEEAERWFQEKMKGLQITIITGTKEVETYSVQLKELKMTYQSLEIKLQSIRAEIQCRYQSLEETKSRFSIQLNQLQLTINMLEVELQQLRDSLEQQRREYNLLLDIKMRLELEIVEYRRLLDGEYKQAKAVIISKVVEHVEEKKPHIERRVKIITEEIIDGKVVSSSVDTQVEDIQ
ncbi:keratin, type I cytoskeletal 42-like [Scomber scombrus]|uniref:keratin, type I cytoskeletal 42-like n=1 Tax=Scomber scombrus TaxID=13677 RepID=UPI002DD88FCA|nr:keratin, type I cytoskeletal 42-like [Scomber scombrus]